MGASIDEPAANRCGVRGWGSSSIDRGNFVHSEGFAPLNQCPVARIPDLFALSMFKEFHILEAVHGYGLLRQTQWKFPASGSVHEKGFTLPETIFIGTVFCQDFTPSLLSVCPHPWVQYNETKASDCVKVKRWNLSASDAHISTAFRTLKPDCCISIIPRVDGFCQYDGGNITALYAWFLEMFL